MTTTLLLGIGNLLLSDEGAGLHALRFFEGCYGPLPGVRYVDGGTLSFTLLGEIEKADRWIVFDAARLDVAPGGVRTLEGADMDAFMFSGRASVHEIGLADIMDIARLLDRLPEERALIGIQPATMDWGETPSQAVTDALPQAAALAFDLISKWHRRAAPDSREDHDDETPVRPPEWAPA